MDQLFHLPISPACRKVRLALGEKGHEVELVEERDWEGRREFLALNPAGEVPVLLEESGRAICGATPIVEFLEDSVPDRPLLPGDAYARAEARRLAEWFDKKFAEEVSLPLIHEKVTKRFMSAVEGGGSPDMAVVRATLYNVRYHLDYISYLMEDRRWLAGEAMSLADITAAAHLSCLDYIGDVPWSQFPQAKEWYVRLKSRPSFRALLADHVPGMPPPRVYANLDF
jgi:glutathione S-transferase